MSRNYILDKDIAARKLQRMAYEIVESNLEIDHIILAGIRDNGSVIAGIMHELLNKIAPFSSEVLHISLDKRNPSDITLSQNMDFNSRSIILVDDVVNSGKTLLYAMKPFLSFQPRKIQTLALVDRTHKTFPVKTDYVGISVATTLLEHIYVEVEGNIVTGAYLE